MKPILIVCFLHFTASPACLWINGTTIDGASGSHGGRPIDFSLRLAMEGKPETAIARKLADVGGHDHEGDSPDEVDAVIAVSEGKYEEAISILRTLEEKGGNEYGVAANLGTSYELSGDLDQALHWIREGMKRNPEAHMGSEWLHVLILEEKIRLRDSAASTAASDFIAIPERVSAGSILKIGGKDYPVTAVHAALAYQLGERMLFVKPKDHIVSEMLYDLAMLEANIHFLEPSVGLLDLSLRYGFRDPALINAKKREYSAVIARRERRPYIIACAVLAALVGFLVYAYRKKWFFLSSAAYRKHKNESIRQVALHH